MRLLTILTALVLSIGPVKADEYSKGNYDLYGFGSAASIMTSLHLKAGLRGVHVSDLNEKGNSYYPGYPWMQAISFIHPR